MLKADSNNYGLRCKLAELYQSKGKSKEAIGQYEKALSINPDLIQALHALAFLYGENNEFDKALSLLQKMSILNPGDPDVYYNIACVYAKEDRVKDAEEWLSKAMEKGFNNMRVMKTDPDLDNIRETDFYKKIFTESQN
jgi:tetratricopeptide (TPR) repeat protein